MSEKNSTKTSILKRKRFWLALVYLLLLVCSGIYRSKLPAQQIPNTKKTILLNAYQGNNRLSQKIRLAYKEKLPKTDNNYLPVVLIHGSPGSAEVFGGLAKIIDDRRLISVDLPGFGNSEQKIPDYSIYAHARYLREFLQQKNIEKAHFVGFSLGGGVVLHLAEISPERIASVSFISSIGVQEYELLGNYHLNHFIHAGQLGFAWILQNLTPHFGFFDGVLYSYSRNFYDTDQRPLRKILENYRKPFLIIHGRDDPLVPVEAAREHRRIVPQSEYYELIEDHFFIFQNPEKADDLLKDFWKRVENNNARTYQNADVRRKAQADNAFEFQILQAKGATLVVFFLIISAITFFNEDLAFLLSGIFIFQGRFGFAFAMIACLFGVALSIMLWLLIGKYYLQRTDYFDKFESINIFDNRYFGFTPLSYMAIGKTYRPLWKFHFMFFFIAFSWTLLLIVASYFLAYVFTALSVIEKQNTVGLIFAVIISYFFLSLINKRFTN